VGRFARGWKLTKISWGVLREQPVMLALPLIAAAAEGAVAAGYILGVTGTTAVSNRNAGHYIALYPLYAVLTLIATFANAVVVALADARLRDEPISLRDALHAMFAGLAWSLATIMIIPVLARRTARGRRLTAAGFAQPPGARASR
jgi:hypothetical protein